MTKDQNKSMLQVSKTIIPPDILELISSQWTKFKHVEIAKQKHKNNQQQETKKINRIKYTFPRRSIRRFPAVFAAVLSEMQKQKNR